MDTPRRCIECDMLFENDDPRKLYCSPGCGLRGWRKDRSGMRRNPAMDDPAFFTGKKDPFEERRKRRAEEWAAG
jgi:predicted  nucleic acid-binding Zn-ribbon protein